MLIYRWRPTRPLRLLRPFRDLHFICLNHRTGPLLRTRPIRPLPPDRRKCPIRHIRLIRPIRRIRLIRPIRPLHPNSGNNSAKAFGVKFARRCVANSARNVARNLAGILARILARIVV